jgi:small-conductance mechanosensitive channel
MEWTSYLPTIVPLLIAVGIAVAGLLFADQLARRLRQRGAMPYHVRGARIIVSTIALVVALLVIFIAFGPISAVSSLTFSAILTLAVTLALQTTIGNVIAGFILLRNRVLRLNDTIVISGITGRVVQLGLVTTWLHLEDGNMVSVSNSTLLSGPMINKSARDRLQGEY